MDLDVGHSEGRALPINQQGEENNETDSFDERGAMRIVWRNDKGVWVCAWSVCLPETSGAKYEVEARLEQRSCCSCKRGGTCVVACGGNSSPVRLSSLVTCGGPGDTNGHVWSQDGHEFQLCVDDTISCSGLAKSLVLFVDGGEAVSRLPAEEFWSRRFAKALAGGVVFCILSAAAVGLGLWVATPALAVLVFLLPLAVWLMVVGLSGICRHGCAASFNVWNKRLGYSSIPLLDINEDKARQANYGLV